MGKSKKKYVVIENFRLNFNNRGNSALCYGAVSFLEKYHDLNGHDLLNFHIYNNPFKLRNVLTQDKTENIQGKQYHHRTVPVHRIEYNLFIKYGIRLPFTPFGRAIKDIDYIASDYGGDGFSDIYGERTFNGRMRETLVGMQANVPLIILPQTLGPFKDKNLFDKAKLILRYAKKIYTRDDRFDSEMKRLGIDYQLVNDLSAYMEPEPWEIDIDTPNAIGLNVSGLAYSGGWHDLKGQFDNYPYLVNEIIEYFTSMGKTVYLIPHSYNYEVPETDNDDMVGCRDAYNALKDKSNVIFVDKNLSAPQVKYIISKMSFFIGTRMHANYAAIFTKTPVFGLAYSYKFEGAFTNNGLIGQTAMINNIERVDVKTILDKISKVYNAYCG